MITAARALAESPFIWFLVLLTAAAIITAAYADRR